MIFAIFCERDSSSFHGVRRERRSPRNPLRQETPRNILNRRSQRSLRGKHRNTRISCTNTLFRDISKRRYLMHFDLSKPKLNSEIEDSCSSSSFVLENPDVLTIRLTGQKNCGTNGLFSLQKTPTDRGRGPGSKLRSLG